MPKKPSFIQLDPNELQKTAIDYNTKFYDRADADAYARLGNLYPARDAAVANAAADLTGEDPIYQNVFAQSGLGKVNLGPSAASRSVALRQPVLAGAQRNRNYFETLWKQNPERTFGLNTHDVATIEASNSGNLSAFQGALQQIDARNTEIKAQENAALLGTVVKGAQPLVTAGTNALTEGIGNEAAYYAPSNYLNPSTYVPAAGSYNPGFAPSSYGGAYEGTIDNMPVYRAEPVTSGYNPNDSSGW